jgi:hypothetical protein
MTNFRSKSKSRVNWARDEFYMMIHCSYMNCKIELIENFPCNNEEELKNRKNEIHDKLSKKLKLKSKIKYIYIKYIYIYFKKN